MGSNKLLTLLQETGAMLDGHFLLTSGRHSNVYIEKFRVLEHPRALDDVCRAMAETVQNQNVELVLGAAIGGILIAGGVGRHLGVKHIFFRAGGWKNGTSSWILHYKRTEDNHRGGHYYHRRISF